MNPIDVLFQPVTAALDGISIDLQTSILAIIGIIFILVGFEKIKSVLDFKKLNSSEEEDNERGV